MWRFLPLIFLPASYPHGSMRIPLFGAFDALTINDAGCRTDFAVHRFAAFHVEFLVEATSVPSQFHMWTYMDPARLQQVGLDQVRRSQLLTYIRLPDAAEQCLRREPRWIFARFHLIGP